MIDEAELWDTPPDQTRLVICIYDLREEDVCRQGRDALAARSQQTPGLATQQFKLPHPDVDPVKAQPQAIAVAGDGSIGRHKTQKVRFQVAKYIRILDLGIHTQTDARVLSR